MIACDLKAAGATNLRFGGLSLLFLSLGGWLWAAGLLGGLLLGLRLVVAVLRPRRRVWPSRSGLGFGPLVGLAPSVRISEIRIRTKSWRWPRLRREFLRRRFLKAMTFGAAALLDHLGGDAGARDHRRADLRRVAAEHQHVAELHDLARLALDLSTLSTWSSATRYCLPPVLMTANIVLVPRSTPALGLIRAGFFQSICGVVTGA